MQNPVLDNPETRGARTLSDLKDLLLIVGTGIALLFRWPFAPIWIYRNPSDDYLALSSGAQKAFVSLCLFGLINELGAAWGLVIQPIASIELMPMASTIAFSLGFALTTGCRFIIWILNTEL